MKHINRRSVAMTARNIFFLSALSFTMLKCNEKTTGNNSNTPTIPGSAEISVNATASKTQFAEVNGRKIAYRSIGIGDPIILCQRFRGNLDDWDPAFLDAMAKNYNVIIFDYTGLASSSGDPHTNMMGFASDVTDLAKALGFRKIILGGWSFGGWVAQIVSSEFPELVSQTILIGTRPPGKVTHDMEGIFKQTAYKPINDFEDEVILFFEPISEFSRKAAKESHDRIATRTIDKDVQVKLEQLQFYGKGGEDYAKDPYNARQKLATTKIPILVISGDHEICFPPENWFELNRKLPTTQLVVIPRSGHGPQHQYPEMVADYIHSFIKTNKTRGNSN
jgi:pimeloyl-ACP methyl ester carboxylesterase